jgi:hypothetical protein
VLDKTGKDENIVFAGLEIEEAVKNAIHSETA